MADYRGVLSGSLRCSFILGSGSSWHRGSVPCGSLRGASAKTLADGEPKALRYRLLHMPARLVNGQRRRRLKIPKTWPRAAAIAAVFANIVAIPQPA